MFSLGTAGAHHSLGTPTNTKRPAAFPAPFLMHALRSNAHANLRFGTEYSASGQRGDEGSPQQHSCQGQRAALPAGRDATGRRPYGWDLRIGKETGTGWYQGKRNDAPEYSVTSRSWSSRLRSVGDRSCSSARWRCRSRRERRRRTLELLRIVMASAP